VALDWPTELSRDRQSPTQIQLLDHFAQLELNPGIQTSHIGEGMSMKPCAILLFLV